MRDLRNYHMGVDPWGTGLFLLIMLPNIVWSALPASNDVLRKVSATPLLDAAGQIFQVVMVAALCAVVNRLREQPMERGYRVGTAACVVLYFAGWAAYYDGNVSAAVLLILCLAPCGAFLLFALGRKNAIALIPAGVFTACHLISTVVNFIL